MSGSLDFVTIEGLLTYGRALARRALERELVHPPPREVSGDDSDRVHAKMEQLRSFVERAKSGFTTSEAYRSERERLRDDQLIFFAAWNALLAESSLQPLLRATIEDDSQTDLSAPCGHRASYAAHSYAGRRSHRPGTGRRQVLVVATRSWRPDAVLHDAPRCLTSGQQDSSRRMPFAESIGSRTRSCQSRRSGEALARMIGIVGQQLDFLPVFTNYLDPITFLHIASAIVPNARQLS